MMGLLHRSIAASQEVDAVDDPETTATKLNTNDPTLKSIVVGPTLPDSLSISLQKWLPPERCLPESKDEWRRRCVDANMSRPSES